MRMKIRNVHESELVPPFAKAYIVHVDLVQYMAKRAWKAFHFTMHILKKGNSNTKSLAYTSLAHPIHEYEVAC
jgi:hypothetical protein